MPMCGVRGATGFDRSLAKQTRRTSYFRRGGSSNGRRVARLQRSGRSRLPSGIGVEVRPCVLLRQTPG